MNSYTAACSLLLLCIATGCDTVTVTQPIGRPASIAELSRLQGVWVSDDQERIEVRTSKAGKLILGVLSWDEETDRFAAQNSKVLATQAGNLRFLHMASADESPTDEYVFCRYDHADDGTLRLYLPVPSCFQEAVQSRTLDGSVSKKRRSLAIKLKATSDELAAFLTTPGAEECFDKKPSLRLTLVRGIEGGKQ